MRTIAVMPSRLQELQEALAGYRQTHVNLVALTSHGLTAAGIGNDLGPFYFVVRIANAFGWSLGATLTVFLGGLLALGLVSGICAITRLWQGKPYYWWAITSTFLLSLLVYKLGDVYVAGAAAVIGLIPWVMLLLKRCQLNNSSLVAWGLIGLAAGLANAVRAESGTLVIIFGLIGLLLAKATLKVRGTLLAVLLVGFLIPGLWLGHLVSVRDEYLASHKVGYQQVEASHTLWHTAYIGFGYLSNNVGLQYLDQVGIDKANQIKPGVAYHSAAYEAILRRQTFALIRSNPLFVLDTWFAKLGVILLFYLPVFANLGLWRAYHTRHGGQAYWPFYVTLGVAALAGVIAVPELSYLTGFAALALLYGLTVLNGFGLPHTNRH